MQSKNLTTSKSPGKQLRGVEAGPPASNAVRSRKAGKNGGVVSAPDAQAVIVAADSARSDRAKSRKLISSHHVAMAEHRSVIRSIHGGGTEIKLATKDVVFRQGDTADAVFYLKTGRIQLTAFSQQGKEGVIALYGPGDFFGEGALGDQPIRMASAIASGAASVAKIEKSAMLRLLREEPDFAEKFIEHLISRTIQVEADLVDQLFNSSEKRLARLLLILANYNNDGHLHVIAPKISQDVLASRVGTTRSRINFFLNKFRKLGLIEYNGTMKIHTSLLNVIVHD